MPEPPITGQDVLERNRGLIDALQVPDSFKSDFAQLVRDAVGRVWERPGLDPAQRSLATIAMLAALVRPDELRAHIGMGLDNGLSPDQICELMLQCAVYAGFPAAVRGFEVVTEEFEARGLQAPGGR